MSRDLLLEIGTEDLPARYVMPLAEALRDGIGGGLRKRGIAVGDGVLFATPRRIAVRLGGVPERQPDQTVERLGPALAAALKEGQPTPAALGFAKSCGVEFSALGEKDGKLFYAKQAPGRATAELLPEIFEDTIKQMDELVPKRMRWGSSDETFVRPVQWLTCLLGSDVVPLSRFGLVSGAVTYGHRFHAPEAITLKAPADYEGTLKAAKVWADVASRKAEIRRQIVAEAQRLGGHVRINEDLLGEVTALVEWPVAIVGRFEERFLELPPEVIVATVETNQRYFTVFKDAEQTQLTNAFITLSNIESRDVAQVVAGNERVVRPRLTDALFFWQQDLKQPLSAYADKLGSVTFQKDLGSIGDKVARIRKLAGTIAAQLGVDTATTERAAALCKADLVTKMVYEFPELQGLMGGYYATKAGDSAAVARAVREHYLPTQQGTSIPSTPEGRIVSLADKLDTLAGIFAIGQKPSASKDPFALRRAALGVLRICLEADLALDLTATLKAALDAQPAGKRDAATLQELVEFVMERLRALVVGQSLDGRDVTVEMFESVRSLGITAPLDFYARLKGSAQFASTESAQPLSAAHKRVRNLLKQTHATPLDKADAALMPNGAEAILWQEMIRTEKAVSDLTKFGAVSDYGAALQELSRIAQPVDDYFKQVMVMDPNAAIREHRLRMLARLDKLCRSIVDLSCLPG